MHRNKLHRIFLWSASLLLMSGLAAQSALAQLPDFTGLVKKNAPAVVNISTTHEVTSDDSNQQDPLQGLPEDSPFREFFKRFYDQQRPQGPQEYKVRSLGSGFIISSDGYIITNNHVIANADQIRVRLNDHSEYKAKVIGTDKRSDVALLKIDAKNLPTVKLGDSSKLQVGQWVLAIGSPFGLDYSATAGIISALGRNLPNEAYVPFIQTDVAVNPGNSGGPLFDLDGEVIGINSQIYTNTGGYMGLSFAIPINVVMDVVHQLKTKGYVSRGWLGVYIQSVNKDLADSFGLKKPVGALVTKVMPKSPAAKAGFKSGDVILSFDGHEVQDSTQLPALVGATPIGKRVPVKIIRDGEHKTLMVTIAALKKQDEQAMRHHQHQGKLNISVTDLNSDQRAQLGTGDRGVLVRRVGPGPAADAGIQPGDVILMLNHKDIKNTADLSEIVQHLPKGRPVPVLIQRKGGTIFLALKMPGK
jgi:serine protease Do